MSYTVFPRISAYALESALPRVIVVVYRLLLFLNEYRDRLPLFKEVKNFYNIKNQTVRFDLLQVPFQRNDLE